MKGFPLLLKDIHYGLIPPIQLIFRQTTATKGHGIGMGGHLPGTRIALFSTGGVPVVGFPHDARSSNR